MKRVLIALIAIMAILSLSACTNKKSSLELVDIGEYIIKHSPYQATEDMYIITDARQAFWGTINKDGNIVLPVEYSLIMNSSDWYTRAMYDENYKPQITYVDKENNRLEIKIEGKSIKTGESFLDGYAIVFLDDNQNEQYVIDKEGNVILEPTEKEFSYVNLGKGVFKRTSQDVSEIIDNKGNVLHKENLLLFDIMNEEEVCFYMTNQESKSFGLIKKDGLEKITEPIYMHFSPFKNGTTGVYTLENELHIINDKGETITNLGSNHENIEVISRVPDWILAFKIEDGYNIVNGKGEQVLKVDYDIIYPFYDGVAVCKKDDKFGYIDTKGNEILEPIYDNATFMQDGVSFVSRDGETFKFTYK